MQLPPFPYLQHHPFGNPAPITLDHLIPFRNLSFSPVSLPSTTSILIRLLFSFYSIPPKFDGHPETQAFFIWVSRSEHERQHCRNIRPAAMDGKQVRCGNLIKDAACRQNCPGLGKLPGWTVLKTAGRLVYVLVY